MCTCANVCVLVVCVYVCVSCVHVSVCICMCHICVHLCACEREKVCVCVSPVRTVRMCAIVHVSVCGCVCVKTVSNLLLSLIQALLAGEGGANRGCHYGARKYTEEEGVQVCRGRTFFDNHHP